MGKAKRADKKARKRDKQLEAEMKEDQRRRTRKRQIVLAAVPLLTVALAVGCYVGLDRPSLAGATALGGALVWLMLALGFLGGAVKPKDRNRAGSIDFGNR